MSIFQKISNLARHSAIYAISTAAQKLPGLLLLPIYTEMDYIPSTSIFGEYIMLFSFIAFMNFFYIYGMDSAMMRYFFLDDKDRKQVFSATFFVLIFTSIITTCFIFLASPFLADTLLKNANADGLFRITGFILFFDALGNLPYLILRAEEKSIQFSLFRGLRFTLELLFNILFVVILRWEIEGILYTSLAASVINFLVMLPVISRYLTTKFDFALSRELLAFGLPFLPNGIAFTIIEMIDRFLVPEFLGKEAVGIYGASYKFSAILMILISAFRNAWQPFFLKIAGQEGAKSVYSRVLTYYLLGAGTIIILVTLFIRDLLTYNFFGKTILGAAYHDGIGIIPIILLSHCFYGIYIVFTPGFYIEKKSKYMFLFTGSGALVNIIANLILLPWLNSFWGAAWATLFSYFTMALTIYLVANKIYPLKIEWLRVFKVFLTIITIMLLYYLLPLHFSVRIGLAIIAVMFFYWGILSQTERQLLQKQVQRLRSFF